MANRVNTSIIIDGSRIDEATGQALPTNPEPPGAGDRFMPSYIKDPERARHKEDVRLRIDEIREERALQEAVADPLDCLGEKT